MLATILSPMAGAEDEGALTTYPMLSPNTALEVAQAAMTSCSENGYQVAVAVVDRMGITQVVLRDRFAGPHTPDTAWRKARTAVSFRTDTLSLSSLTAPGASQSGARFIPDTLMIGGGVPVESQGFIIGAAGVSGSPGGPQDDACARAAIKAIQDKLSSSFAKKIYQRATQDRCQVYKLGGIRDSGCNAMMLWFLVAGLIVGS